MTDTLHHFHFKDSPIRGELVQLPEVYSATLLNHDYPKVVKTQLGQALAAVALMAGTLKFEGSLILQIQGSGPLSLLMVECNDQGDMRGIARYDESLKAVDAMSWADLLGDGQCILTVDPAEGERYQGIVSLEGQSLADVLAHYFIQSEQLPTHFWLFADAESAGGLLLQVLPGHDHDDESAEHWSRVVTLTDTLAAHELLELDANTVLYRLYHEEQVMLLEQRELQFRCSCSRQRSVNALRAIDPIELQTIAAEQGGSIEVNCQFCHAKYVFDEIDLAALAQHSIETTPSSLQ